MNTPSSSRQDRGPWKRVLHLINAILLGAALFAPPPWSAIVSVLAVVVALLVTFLGDH